MRLFWTRAGCGTNLPPQDAAISGLKKPRLLEVSPKWTRCHPHSLARAMDGFFHGQRAASCLVALAVVSMASPLVGPAAAAEPSAGSRPNILFLFADDFTYEAVRAFGHTDIDTPNLDRLAASGTTFSHAYNMGSWSGAVCVASRTMLITGRSVWDANQIYQTTDAEREAGVLWPQLMSKAGYRTYMTGKWHIRTDAAKCFDVALHVRPGMPKDTPSAYSRPPAEGEDPWSPSDRSLGGFWEGGKHWSEVTADDAIDFLSDAAMSEQPAFFYVAFNAPHDPRQSPQAVLDRYPVERIALPEPFLPEYPYAEAIGAGRGLRDEKLAPFPRTERAVKVHRREYYALITHLDEQIGRILDALEASGQADRTWIFFTADHGLAVGHHGLLGKQNSYDHSTRVPFIVAGPGVRSGVTDATPIYLQDVMATSLELAAAERPEHVFYTSLLPWLTAEPSAAPPPPYASIYGSYLDRQRSITHDGWKLLVYPKAAAVRLYNLANDPEEAVDLAIQPEHAPRLRKLFDRLRAVQQELGDTVHLTAVSP
jgi:arylsulfatase A-like enzyme